MIELRILGAALAALWFATFALVLVGYQPGGPADRIVGVAAGLPILIALAGVVWPPVARGDRAFAAIAWLGLGVMLLMIPSIASVAAQVSGQGSQTLVPSLEAAYPWILALVGTSLFAGLGIARRRLGETALRRRRVVMGAGFGLVLALLGGSGFTTAAVVNELSLRDQPTAGSRFGPTDPTGEPPTCSGPMVAGQTAALELLMDASIDGRLTGQVSITGTRSGPDVRWTGFAATRVTLGQHGLTRIGDHAWVLRPGSPWATIPASQAAGEDLDRQLLAVALTTGNRTVSEDRGLDFIEGARARHCRVTVDGGTLRRAVPEIELLVGSTDMSRWRGDLDYWVFIDGQLGQADIQVTGPATELSNDALLATLRLHLTAVDRGLPVSIQAPGP
jgi:hypothetical protein